MDNISNIQGVLKRLGISGTQTRLYIKLLEIGPASIADLTRHIRIPRSTVRINLDKLLEKGLVSQTVYKTTRKLVPEEPNKLRLLLEDEKLNLENRKNEILKIEKNLIQAIKDLYEVAQEESKDKTTIKVYEGKKNVLGIYKETLEVNEVYAFVNLDKYYEVFPNTSNLWDKALETNEKRHLYAISVESALSRKIKANRHPRYFSKFIPGVRPFGGLDFHIYDNKVAIIQLDPKSPIAILLSSKIIFTGMKAIHQTLWTNAID